MGAGYDLRRRRDTGCAPLPRRGAGLLSTVAILGPTASGKSEIAEALAEAHGAEIVSVDSMQVYRGMDVGTAKPTVLERRGVVHHMIDLVEPEEEFSVAEFRRRGRYILKHSEGPMIITGGSGLHFRALVDPMSFAPTDPNLRAKLEAREPLDVVASLRAADPDADRHVDMANPRRVVRALEIYQLSGETPSSRAASAEAEDLRRYVPEIEFTAVGIDPGEVLEERLARRVQRMRDGGLLEEVQGLKGRLGRTAAGALGYRELAAILESGGNVDEAFSEITRNTRKLAKKQRTWFQRDPRITWIPWLEDVEDRASRVLEVMS